MGNLQNKTKGQKILEIIICYATSILLLASLIYFERTGYGFGISIWVLGIFIIAISVAAGTKGILDIKKENLSHAERDLLESSKRYTKIEKRKKNQRITLKKHDTMQKEFFWSLLEFRLQVALIGVIVFALFCCSFCRILWIKYEFHIMHLCFIFIAIVFVSTGVYLSAKHAVQRFEGMITNSGYNLQEVASDYMHGVGCIALSGYINIGYQYSLCCSFDKESFIIPHDKLIGVEKRAYTETVDGIDGKVARFCIRFYTDYYWREFLIDDIGADVVLQEYEKRGMKTRTVDMR